MGFKTTHRIIRALVSRFLCLCHIGLSIFVLYSVKKNELYLLPMFGAVFLIVETFLIIILSKGKELISWFSPAFFIYVSTIVSCYWFLELENIKKLQEGQLKRDYKISFDDLKGDIVGAIKIIWSQVELQIFFALIMIVRFIIPRSSLTPHMFSDLLFKYFAISCDMLDFLSILQDGVLVKNEKLVYATLSAWSWSCIQFFIYVPKYEDEEKREFNAYITNTLLSTFFLDLPFFTVRISAIFFCGSHNYNSYFFTIKNICMILLQIIRIHATFAERHIRQENYAKTLRYKMGTDKQSGGSLFDPNEMAKRKFIQQRLVDANLNNSTNNKQQVYSDNSGDDLSEKEAIKPRVPRMIETVKPNKRVAFEQVSSINSLDNLNEIKLDAQPDENKNFKENMLKKPHINQQSTNIEPILKKAFHQPVNQKIYKYNNSKHTEI